ncbi:MAG: 3-phosphoshikimate 1-carboxyvinyltransferase [Acidobacteria bacterium]|nr:3-phosphoshikimate 1-carboxyvinyltransferase [Acidobacteriota bacterium]
MPPNDVLVRPAARFGGRVRAPGDKSISHRYAMLAAVADGNSVLHGFAPGADARATCACLRALGVEIRADFPTLTIIGRGPGGLCSPKEPLDALNSGTTARLMAGLLAGLPLTVTFVGDPSLSRRPMERIAAPLRRMGARVSLEAGHLPMRVEGGGLEGIDYEPAVASAQVKSAVLLAGLHARGRTRVIEPVPTRNHTGLALRLFGAAVELSGGATAVEGGARLHGVDARVPGDLSSATFWMAAAAGMAGGWVEIEGVGLNPTRTAILGVLRRAGANVEVSAEQGLRDGEEPRGRISVRHGSHRSFTIAPEEVPGLIDELPALAALATFGGSMSVTGAGELRHKESDRIAALVRGLTALGADVDEQDDGFEVRGGRPLRGGTADASGDHRLAMAFAIAALGAEGPSVIQGADAVDVSYPGFFETLAALTA